MVISSETAKWQKGKPESSGGYYAVAVEYPNAMVYDISFLSSDPTEGLYWSPSDDSYAGSVRAYIRLYEVLETLTGKSAPEKKLEEGDVEGFNWSFGEPPKDQYVLVSTPVEYNIIKWCPDSGWPSYMSHVEGYVTVKDLLLAIDKHIPFKNRGNI
ncbi:hypothetical protein ACJJIR_01245 [Microbulbifer sp. SSSA008]|uniref:hypothetical protein n=1 Tax=Microbulbifer sp. SSSA008 TaxID=3243380 RepID=UPI004039E4E4